MTTTLIRRRTRTGTSLQATEEQTAAVTAPRRLSMASARAPSEATTPVTPGRGLTVRRFAHKNTAAAQAVKESEAREAINEKLKLIAIAEQGVDDAVAKLSALHKEVEEALRVARITEHSDGAYITGLKETFSSQSATIDAKKFKANVPDATFWKCAKIGIGDAKKELGEKEFFRLADVVPGKSNGVSFYLKPAPAPKAKGKGKAE